MNSVPYIPIVGSLMYAMVATRLDIALGVGVVAQSQPTALERLQHWNLPTVQIDESQHRDTSFYSGRAISWRLKLQECRATSTTKAEYITVFDAAKEVIWFGWLVSTFQQAGSISAPVICINSKGAIALSMNPVHYNASKHIDVRYHFVRELCNKRKARPREGFYNPQCCGRNQQWAQFGFSFLALKPNQTLYS